VQEQIRALAEESNRLQRVRRVAPLLAQLADTRDALATLADAPHLPPDAKDRFRDHDAARRDATRDVERETSEAKRLIEQQAALPQDVAALTAQDAIDALAVRHSVVLQAMTDLPKVQADAATLRAKVAEAIEELGLPLAPEIAREVLPATTARRTVQRLISQYAALEAESMTATRELEAEQRRCDQAAQVLATMAEPASPALLRRTIESVRGEGPLDTELARAQRTFATATATAGASLAALPLWEGDMAGLIACPLPLEAEADDTAIRLAAAEKCLVQASSEAAEVASEMAALEEELSRLARGERVPTPDAVATARAERDRVWRLVRRMHEGGPPPDAKEIAALPVGPLPDTFEGLRDQADQLADRRADDAQRVADFLTAKARLDLLRAQRETMKTALTAAEGAAEQAKAAWDAIWVPAGLVPPGPSAMVEWRRARTDVIRLAGVAEAARRDCDDLVARRDRAHATLARLLPEGPGQETLAALLLRAETTCTAAEADAADHRARTKALADAEERLPELQQALNHVRGRLEAWQRAWVSAATELQLPADTTIDTAEMALDAWARIAEAAPAWRTDERRIADMTTSINGFATEVRAVLARLEDSASDEPASVIASRLVRRLTDARKTATDAAELRNRIVAHETAAAIAARCLADAEADIEALRKTAGVADDDALQQAIDRARRRDAAVETIARLERDLLTCQSALNSFQVTASENFQLVRPVSAVFCAA
jgi:hypothetical protein